MPKPLAIAIALSTCIGAACGAPATRAVTTTTTAAARSDAMFDAGDAQPVPERPGIKTIYGYAMSEFDLGVLTVCADSLGVNTADKFAGSCIPCMPLATYRTNVGAREQARRLWRHIGRSPHDITFSGSACADIAYHIARKEFPGDPSVVVEASLFRLASRNDSLRAYALESTDRYLDSLLARGDSAIVGELLEQFGRGMWERAQRMLERPSSMELHPWEEDAHALARRAPKLRLLPAIPRTSSRIGVSEAEWSARLFDAAVRLAPTPADRSRHLRLALAPWVTMARWSSLDSAVKAIGARGLGRDSAVLPARALVAYRAIERPVFDQPAVWALFDTALRAMPRIDSIRFDSFEGMLTEADDAWRRGFRAEELAALDTRGWIVLDPVWSTEINELRLARRARVAEADYRFADITAPGQSGSETLPGWAWLRQGAIAPAFTLRPMANASVLSREWGADRLTMRLEGADDMWRGFYSGHFSPQRIVHWPVVDGCGGVAGPIDYIACARTRRADWSGVPFWGATDTIDVALARFRASDDSVDVYVGARVPLRRFRHRDDTRAKKTDRIGIGLWITSSLGAPLHRASEQRELPKEDVIAWTTQWSPRVGAGEVMHRVEALEPTRPSAARGVLLHTSDDQVTFPLSGFGMSDVLLAAGATSRRGAREANRWSDLEITPNGGVIAPRQTFTLAWETYDLATAPDGMMHWHVTVRRETGRRDSRDDMRAMLRGDRQANDRVLASDPEVPALEYTRVARPSKAIVDHIQFNLNDVPPGRHVVIVRVEDLTTRKVTSRSVTVRVLPPRDQRRLNPLSPDILNRSLQISR